MYDLAWCVNLFDKFDSLYRDSASEVRRILGITKNDVIGCIQSDQPRWRQYKRLVKVRARVEGEHEQMDLFVKEFHQLG